MDVIAPVEEFGLRRKGMEAKSAPKKNRSLLKRVRQAKKRQLRNKAMKSKIKTFTRKLEDSIQAKNQEGTHKYLREAARALSKASSKGIIHKNTSSRKISRLTKKANSLLKPEPA